MKKLLLASILNYLCFTSITLSQTTLELFGPNARSMALGGSLVVQARDPSAIYWNPAALSGLKDRTMLISVNDPFEVFSEHPFSFGGLSNWRAQLLLLSNNFLTQIANFFSGKTTLPD